MATVLNVCKGPPTESLFNDFQNINKLTKDQFIQLAEIILQFVSSKSKQQQGQFSERLEKFCSEEGLSVGGLKNATKSFLFVTKGSVKKGLTIVQLREDLQKLRLNEDKIESYLERWQKNYSFIANANLSDLVMVNRLVDMEWKFGVTAASSELNKVGNTFLQLKLVIDKGNNQLENVYMELSLSQFYSFLHEMERARASLEYLS